MGRRPRGGFLPSGVPCSTLKSLRKLEDGRNEAYDTQNAMRQTTPVKSRRQNKQKLNLCAQEARKSADLAPGGMFLFPFSGLLLEPLLAGAERKRPPAHRAK